jgi:hypothetical protein
MIQDSQNAENELVHMLRARIDDAVLRQVKDSHLGNLLGGITEHAQKGIVDLDKSPRIGVKEKDTILGTLE